MRKLKAIVFVVLLLMNVLGYYGVFLGMQYRNTVEMIEKLDDETYDPSQEVTIKIPIVIPYAYDSPGFERVDGEFEYQGEFYRLVKQRLSKDTLYIVCIKDPQAKLMNEAFEKYVKTFSDNPTDSQSNDSKVFSTFIKDYIVRSFAMCSSSLGWEHEIAIATSLSFFISSFSPSIIHPPERGIGLYL